MTVQEGDMTETKGQAAELCPRLGKIAVDMGFVTPDQVQQGMAEQLEDNLSGRPHRVFGVIFFKHGWMTAEEVEAVVSRVLELSPKT